MCVSVCGMCVCVACVYSVCSVCVCVVCVCSGQEQSHTLTQAVASTLVSSVRHPV